MGARKNPDWHQLALDLVYRPAFGREDFLVGSSNAAAVAWLDRWPDWPGRGLVIHGPAASGKSHLASVWRATSGARVLDTQPEVLRQATAAHHAEDCVVVEDIDPPLDERALLHLYNAVTADGGYVLMTARAAPAAMTFTLPDLASRLRALPAVALSDPDDDLLAVVLMKLLADRQISVKADVVRYLVERMERSFEAAGRVAAALDRASLAARRPIGKGMAGEVLAQMDTS